MIPLTGPPRRVCRRGGPGAATPCSWRWPARGSEAQAPLLVGAAVARPEDDLRAVGGAGAVGVEAEPGLHAGDSAVGVDVPLLVGLSVAVPDDHLGADGGAASVGVE